MSENSTSDSHWLRSNLTKRQSFWLLTCVLTIGVLAMLLSAVRSDEYIMQVRFELVDPKAEVADFAFAKMTNSRPDYAISLQTYDGHSVEFVWPPNTSAADGLRWTLKQPIKVDRIAKLKLIEQDKVASDTLVVFKPSSESFVSGNFSFSVETERKISVDSSQIIGKPGSITFGIAVCVMIIYVAGFVSH